MKKFWGFFLVIGLFFPTFILAQSPGALYFDGYLNREDYVDIGNNPILRFGTGDFTLETWVKFTTPWGGISIIDGIAWDWSKAYAIEIVNGAIDFFTYDDSTGDEATAFSPNFNQYNDDNWHHVVGIRQSNILYLYVDGILVASDAETNPIDVSHEYNLSFAYSPANDTWFEGYIAEVRMYNRALSGTEALEHYNDLYRDETGLVGFWHLSEMEGTVAYDSTSYQNHGTIHGAPWVEGRPIRTLSAVPAYRPIVEIQFPKLGDRFGENVEIQYLATDENNRIGPSNFALGDDAVSIFYSEDGGGTWQLIAEDLPPEGSYRWDVSDFKEGDFYIIKVLAKDRSGEKDDEISERFMIDKTPPLFDVSVEPVFSRGENVVITIQATEPLSAPPEVFVYQRNLTDIYVPMFGEDIIWEGNYQVRSGYDGTAKISVVGKDLAGNTSTIIRKGGFFNIGINPPPTPIVTTPLDNDIIDTSFISILGNVREDTRAILFLNNERIRDIGPDSDGNFVIENIELSRTFNKGINILQIFSEDKGGSLSEPLSLSVKFNILPDLKITEPKAGDILFSTTTINILASDENGDELTFKIEASYDQGVTWTELISNLKVRAFVWNTRQFPDREYILRVTANDGFEDIIVISEKFSLLNFLPVISFDKERIITNKSSLNIAGLAELHLERYGGKKKNITIVEYSLDQGKTWLQAQAEDGNFDTISERFIIPLNDLGEGIYEILLRAKDTIELIGRAKIVLIVDFGPPPVPIVEFPKAQEVFGEREDLIPEKAGVQIRVGGTAEADNQIIVSNGSLVFEGLSDDKGNFDVEVTLREHGENILKISATDPAGNKSKTEATLIVIKNNPPKLKFLWPRINGGLNRLAEIVFEIQDPDLDPIKESSLSYRKRGDQAKIILARNLRDNTFSWEVSNFQEGFYELTLEATDGVSPNAITREFIIDNAPPEVSFEPLEKTSFNQAFTLIVTGRARDNFSGIEYVEYSLDLENWFKALITSGYKEKTATFQVKHPFELQDGNYQLTFRASDVSGNVSKLSESQEIIVDTTSPRIGSYTLSVGTIMLLPGNGSFKIPMATKVKLVISLEEDTQRANLLIGNQRVELIKKVGLWENEFSLSDREEREILISAEDILGNQTRDKEIGTIETIERPRVLSLEEVPIEGVKMTVLVFDIENQSWVRWQGEAYDLSNPVLTDESGQYQLLLPTGKYQILLQKSGFKRLKSSSFEFLHSQFINFDFKLEPRSGLRGFFEDLIEKVSF